MIPGLPPKLNPPPPKRSGIGCLVWAIALPFGFLSVGVSVVQAVLAEYRTSATEGDDEDDSSQDPGRPKPPAPPPIGGAVTQLGRAVAPEDTDPKVARAIGFYAPLRPSRYQLAYGMSENRAAEIRKTQESLSTQWNVQVVEGEGFEADAPESCGELDNWTCAYRQIARNSHPSLLPLTALFRSYAQKQQLNQKQLVELVTAYVQALEYEKVSAKEFFGVVPPAVVAADQYGDCDSKALLAVMLLKNMGVEAAVLSSSRFRHAALGVALPLGKKRVKSLNHEYAFVELTAKGWGVGEWPPSLGGPSDWSVLHVEGYRKPAAGAHP